MHQVKGNRVSQPGSGQNVRSPPPLHCLLAFEAAGRNASLAKAAGELRVTVSALTQSIAVLEDRLGLELVRSLAPVVELTVAGERYLRSVQSFSMRLRDGLFEGSALGRTQLRVTAPQALGRMWLAPRLADFVRRHPRIDLVLTCTERYEAVRGGGVDVGLRIGGTDDDGLVSMPLWNDRLIAVAAPALAARADGLSLQELAASLPLIDHPVANWQRWLSGIAMPRLRPLVACTDLHMAIEAAVHGIGVAIAPSRLVGPALRSRQLQAISGHWVPAQPYCVVVAAEQRERLAVRLFLGWLEAQCSEAAGDA